MCLRQTSVALLLAAGAACPACIITPHFRHIEHVDDVERVKVGQTTREEVRAMLGAPSMVDTPELYVYAWEKGKAYVVIFSTSGGAGGPIGYKGTRALFVFDDDGRVARAEVRGTGQGKADTPEAVAEGLPPVALSPLIHGACADGPVTQVRLSAPGPRIVIQRSDEIVVCDPEGTIEIGRLEGKFHSFVFSPDGRLAAGYDHELSLTLRDGSSLELLRELEPSPEKGLRRLRSSVAITFSADGRRVAAHRGDRGVTVYDTATGKVVLRLTDRQGALLSTDGALIVTGAQSGLFLTEVDTGRDVALRPPPETPTGGGPAAFSPDGRRLALASCAHAEIWDLGALISSEWRKGLEVAFLLPFSKFYGVCRSNVAFSSDGAALEVFNGRTLTLYDLVEHRVRASQKPGL